MKPKTKVRSRLSIIMMAVTVVAVVPAFVMIRSRVRYLAQLEAPTQYNHPYAGRVDERVMPVAEVRALCTSVGASGAFVACAWVSDGVAILSYRTMSERRFPLTVGTKLPIAMVGRKIIPAAAEVVALRQRLRGT